MRPIARSVHSRLPRPPPLPRPLYHDLICRIQAASPVDDAESIDRRPLFPRLAVTVAAAGGRRRINRRHVSRAVRDPHRHHRRLDSGTVVLISGKLKGHLLCFAWYATRLQHDSASSSLTYTRNSTTECVSSLIRPMDWDVLK